MKYATLLHIVRIYTFFVHSTHVHTLHFSSLFLYQYAYQHTRWPQEVVSYGMGSYLFWMPKFDTWLATMEGTLCDYNFLDSLNFTLLLPSCKPF